MTKPFFKFFALITFLLGFSSCSNEIPRNNQKPNNMSIYQFDYKLSSGQPFSSENLKGKVVLIVNTATKCGLTPQFKGLEELHTKYASKGLVVLGFPCNQFLGQEPNSNEEMAQVCQINHGVTFPLMEKIKVNGSSAHPLYVFLKKSLKRKGFSNKIRWNFEKFLINPSGKPVLRYSPKTKPRELEEDIKRLLESV